MIDIVKASIENTELISEISGKTFVESHGHSASEKDITDYVLKNYSVETITKELQKENNNYYLLYYNQQAIGFSNIVFNAPNPKIESQTVTKLDRIYILEAFHGLKLGKHFFDFNLQLSKQHEQTGMWLYVWIENTKAIGFYEKNGFKIIANTSFKISENHSNPNYWMYKAFDEH